MLKKYLPPKYGIAKGFLVDRNGNQSKQTDVIIYDRLSHPFISFESSENVSKFIPIDSTVATIEVKTTLKDKIAEAFDNISSTRKKLTPINPHVVPAKWGERILTGYPSSFIFAFRSGWSKSESIKEAVKTQISKAKILPKSAFDLLYVHNKDITLGWVYNYPGSEFLVRPCDHWEAPLHLTEITPNDPTGKTRLGLYHFLSKVFTFVSWFQVAYLDYLLYYYGPPAKMKYMTEDEPQWKMHPGD